MYPSPILAEEGAGEPAMHRCLRKPFFRRWGMDNLASSDVQQEDQADMLESPGAGVVVDRGIDKARSRYPYCIVWTPLPLVTWFIPLIGEVRCSTRARFTAVCIAHGANAPHKAT